MIGPATAPGLAVGHPERVDEHAVREQLVGAARRLVAEGLCTGTAGNLSTRVAGGLLITPSGVDPGDLEAADLCFVGDDGSPSTGGRPPSSELAMHRAVYRASGAGAVVHTHPPYGTALSCAVAEVPSVHYLVARFGGPVRVAPYALFGTEELARNVVAALAGRSAALLAQHGAITTGATLHEAMEQAVLLEWLCQVTWLALQTGAPRTLSDGQLRDAADQFSRLRYGQA